MKFGEQETPGNRPSNFKSYKRAYALLSYLKWQEGKPGVKVSAHTSSWLAPYCRKKNLAKFQLVNRFTQAVRGIQPVGAAEVSSVPTVAELHCFTVISDFCKQQYCCYQLSSRALCYQLRTSKAVLWERYVT